MAKKVRSAEQQRERNPLFNRVLNELESVMRTEFIGTLGEAMHTGNTALMCIRLINGDYDVNEVSYNVTTADWEDA